MIDRNVSILIPCFKRKDLLEECLKSILRNNRLIKDYQVEFIILNEGWLKDSWEITAMMTNLGIKNKLIADTGQTKTNRDDWRSPSYAFNQGAKLAESDWLILMCPEILCLTHAIDMMVLNAEKGYVVIPDGRDDFKNEIKPLLVENKFDEVYKRFDELKHLNTRLPFCMLISKEEYLVNPYNEVDLLPTAGYEDNLFVDTLVEKGMQYRFLDQEKIIHLWHQRISYDKNNKDWQYNESQYKQLTKNFKKNSTI
jgi:hypothetical protein